MLDKEQLANAVKGAEKPDQAVAMELATFFHTELEKMEGRLGERINQAMNLNAATVKRMNELDASFQSFSVDLEHRARDRADKDVKEAKARYDIALQHKDGLSTQERIEVGKVMDDRQAAAARTRADWWKNFWDKVLPSVTTGLIMIIVGPIGLAVFIAILVFILRALGITVQLPTP